MKKSLVQLANFAMHEAMSKETPIITKEKWMEEPLTRGKMEPIIADLKDFIRSTVKGTENALRKELTEKIDGTEKRLSEKVDKIGERIEEHETVKHASLDSSLRSE